MKKLILTTLSIGLALGSFAQQNLHLKNQGVLDNSPRKAKAKSGLSKSARSEWYNSLDMKTTGDFTNYVGFMMNDSLAQYVDATGVASQGRTMQAVGTIIDPKDDIIDLGADPTIKMSKFTNYSIDSVEFPYSYVRRVDKTVDGLGNQVSIVDTLFIYYFTNAQVLKSPKQTWASSLFCTFGWNFAKRCPANYAAIDTVLLTANENTGAPSATGWRLGIMSRKAPNGLSVNANGGNNANNLVGYSILFKICFE